MFQSLIKRWFGPKCQESIQPFPPIAQLPDNIVRAKKLANLLDSAITVPLINKKIGLDPLVGLLPGGGDVILMMLSMYIIWVGIEIGLHPRIITRMVINLLADTLLGAVPLAGDVFDAFFKANQMNVRLLEAEYHTMREAIASETAPTSGVVIDVAVEENFLNQERFRDANGHH